MTTIIFVGRDDSEWESMWGALAEWTGLSDHGEAIGEADPEQGEFWQYMGTYRNWDGGAVHSFRHRRHPITKRREYVTVDCSANFLSRADVQ